MARGGSPWRLVACSVLDPRAQAPGASAALLASVRPAPRVLLAAPSPLAAVQIPFDEILDRPHELPPRGNVIHVLDVDDAAERAVAQLARLGRAAERISPERVAPAERGCVYRLWRPGAWLEEVAAEIAAANDVAGGAARGDVKDAARADVKDAARADAELADGEWHREVRSPPLALDVACGTGRDAVFLGSLGWDVVGVDILPDALERASDLARRYGIGPGRNTWAVMDVEDPGQVERRGISGAPGCGNAAAEAAESVSPGGFEGRFDLICVARFLHRPLFAALARWLRPGGSLVYETYTTLHRERFGKPARDAHVLRPGELQSLLVGAGLSVRRFEEGWREGVHSARAWGVKA